MNFIIRRLLLLLILFISLLGFFLTTNPGLYSLVKLANNFLPGRLYVSSLKGSLTRDLRFDIFEYTTPDTVIQLTQGRIDWTLLFSPQPHIQLTHLTFDKVKIITKNHAPSANNSTSSYHLPGSLSVDIRTLTINQLQVNSFLTNNIKAHALIDKEHWIIHQLQLNYEKNHIALQAHGELTPTYPFLLNLQLKSLQSNNNQIEQGTFTISGDTVLYRWQGKFSGLIPVETTGTVNHIVTNPLIDTKIIWGENSLSLTGNPFHQLTVNGSIPQPQIFHPSLLGLQTRINVKGTISEKESALIVTLSPGSYQTPNNSKLPPLVFQGGNIEMNVVSNNLQAKGSFRIDPDKIINFTFNLPEVRFENMGSLTQSIDGKINLNINSLQFLNDFSPNIQQLSGQANATVTVKGSLKKPIIEGNFTLNNSKLFIPELGLHLDSINALLTSHNKQWELQGSIHALNKNLEIKGQGTLIPQLAGMVNILGDHFPLLRTDEYLVDISPKLVVDFNSESYALKGTIIVPTVKLKLASFTKTVNLPDDVEFVEEQTPVTPINSNNTVDVEIKMGPDVAIDVQGLQGVLDGAIQVKQLPNSSLNALGELTIRNGTYKAYDQNLTIASGKLIFSGGALNNPSLSLRAVRKFNNTSSFTGSNQLFDFNDTNIQAMDFQNHLTVGVEVRGHLYSPQLTLFSIPATLSQADIISMLLLGKPSSQASQSGGQILLMAISSMNLDSGSKGKQLLSELKDSLGLDFNVQSGSLNSKTNQSTDNTTVVIGKSLSKRLYLSYNMGLFQDDSSVLILKYLLNKYLSVQITTSDAGDGIDMLYTSHP